MTKIEEMIVPSTVEEVKGGQFPQVWQLPRRVIFNHLWAQMSDGVSPSWAQDVSLTPCVLTWKNREQEGGGQLQCRDLISGEVIELKVVQRVLAAGLILLAEACYAMQNNLPAPRPSVYTFEKNSFCLNRHGKLIVEGVVEHRLS